MPGRHVAPRTRPTWFKRRRRVLPPVSDEAIARAAHEHFEAMGYLAVDIPTTDPGTRQIQYSPVSATRHVNAAGSQA